MKTKRFLQHLARVMIALAMLARGTVRAQSFPTPTTQAVTVNAAGWLVNNFASTTSSTIDLRLGTVLLNSTSTINGLTATSYSSGWSMAGGGANVILTDSSSYQLMGTGGAVSLSGNLTTAGAFPLTLTLTSTTSLTLPTGGTLATLGGSEAFTNHTYNGLSIATTTGTLSITNAKNIFLLNTLSLSGTDGSTLNIGAGGTLGAMAFLAGAAANALTTATLASGVTFSSLTTLGVITAGTWQGTAVDTAYIGAALTGKTYNGLNVIASTGSLSITGGGFITTSGSFTASGSGLLSFGAGGTLGTAAYTNTTSFFNVTGGGNTITGTNSFSGTTFAGTNTFTSTNTFSGSNTFSSTNTFSGTNTHSGNENFAAGSTVSYAAGITAPAVAKAWGVIKGSDGTLLAGYGVASTARSGTGVYQVTFSASVFSSASYSPLLSTDTSNTIARVTNATANAASFSMTVQTVTNSALDPTSVYFTIFGN